MRVVRAVLVGLRGALLAGTAIALAGCTEPTVVRVVDGKPVAGRFISEAAYAFFARGAEAETAGNLGRALRAFELCAVEDPESPEVWTRLGALHCRAAPPGPVPAAANEAFARVEALDPSFGPLHRERARCLFERGSASEALEEAERALALDPDNLDTTLVRAEALERAGRVEDARRALRAAALRRPGAAEPWIALLGVARRNGNAALVREAAARAAALAPGLRASLRADVPELAPLAAIDTALRAGDLAQAQRRALEARLPGAEVALRAVALGRTALGREQAELVLGADPADASARIALAAAADLGGDLAALGSAMRAIPRGSARPSPLARLLFAEVLVRRVGAEAARAWLGHDAAAGPDGGSSSRTPRADPLLVATEKRVLEAVSGR